ncbi:MAG TPA: hypothetical protein VII42_14845 [Caulobacteraceae bacterium]|jgi:hypothetical protein
MPGWTEFYAVIGGAAAALLGLLFVVVSLNAAAILSGGHESSKRLAEQAFQNYLAVMMVSLLALFPGMSAPTFGAVTLCVTGVWAAWVLVRLFQTLSGPQDHEPRLFALRRHFSTVVGFAILIVTAVRMALHLADDRNLFASGTIVLLFSATIVSWELLGRIARSGLAVSGP